jgi:hypothetical protein
MVGVRVGGAVTGRDVKHAVVAKGEVAAVVTVGIPFDNDLRRFRIEFVGWLRVHRVARDARLLGAAHGAVVADVEVAVFGEIGVEGHAVGDTVKGEQHLEAVGVGVVLDAKDAAVTGPGLHLLNEDQAVTARLMSHPDGADDLQLGKGADDAIGRRRTGEADDVRGVPRDAVGGRGATDKRGKKGGGNEQTTHGGDPCDAAGW